jgi:glycosyltransferase involved in cell wall biosynthesis
MRPSRAFHSLNRFQHEVEAASEVLTLPVSHFLRERMIEAGCPADDLRVILSPAPEVDGPFRPVDRASVPRFLFLGRLAPQKGLEWLLRSFAQLSVDAHLDIAGTGDLLEPSRQLAHDLEIEDRVTFHGWIDADRIPSLISACRAVVFPSVWHEPAGLVSLEAAAHGRALVASRVGGIPEYATEDNAIFVSPNDTAALTDALRTLALNPDRADTLGRRGWDLARSRFSMDKFLDQMDDVYESLLSKRLRGIYSTAP